MSAKAISEYDAKRLVSEHIKFEKLENKFKAISVSSPAQFDQIRVSKPWATQEVTTTLIRVYLLPKF